MREYVHNTAAKWKDFQSSNIEIAANMRELVLSICSNMTSSEDEQQIEAMKSSSEIGALRELMRTYSDSLGIREASDNELALWIRTICYLETSDRSHS